MNEFLIAFKSLADDNEAEFNHNLIKAIKTHQEVWSQKKGLNRGGTPDKMKVFYLGSVPPWPL